jgi:hypothetical protein
MSNVTEDENIVVLNGPEDVKSFIQRQAELEIYAEKIGLSKASAMFMVIRLLAVSVTVVGWSILPKFLSKTPIAKKFAARLATITRAAGVTFVSKIAGLATWAVVLPGLLDDLADIQDWFDLFNRKADFTNQEQRALRSVKTDDIEDGDFETNRVVTTYSSVAKVFYGLFCGANSSVDTEIVNAASYIMELLAGVLSRAPDDVREEDLVQLQFAGPEQARVFVLISSRMDELFENTSVWYAISQVVYSMFRGVRVPNVQQMNRVWLVLSNTVLRGE